MAIIINISEIRVPDEIKTDLYIQDEINNTIEDVKKIVFMYLNFKEIDLDDTEAFDPQVKEDLKKVIIFETEARIYFKNTQTSLKPPHANLFFSAEAYNLWNTYL